MDGTVVLQLGGGDTVPPRTSSFKELDGQCSASRGRVSVVGSDGHTTVYIYSPGLWLPSVYTDFEFELCPFHCSGQVFN